MRKVVLGMMMTLDGFAAGPNDEMDWLPAFDDEAMWADAHEEMWNALNGIDTILLGRVTYQIWEKYWPSADKNPKVSESDLKFSKYADDTQKVVFSKTLKKVDWRNSRLAGKDMAGEIARLKELPGKNIGVAGGPGLARSLSRLGLIDEYQVTVHPVVLGKGKPLFGDSDSRLKLGLIRSRSLKSGAVVLQYQTLR